jgi:hypothetical protein
MPGIEIPKKCKIEFSYWRNFVIIGKIRREVWKHLGISRCSVLILSKLFTEFFQNLILILLDEAFDH